MNPNYILTALLAMYASGSSGPAVTILDTPLGTAGTGIYSGMNLVAGLDFSTATVGNTIATQSAPKNPLWASHSYTNAGGQRSPASGSTLGVLNDVSADYTGWHDSGRGIPIAYDNGAPQQILPLTDTVSGTTRNALRLHAVRQSAAEKAALNPGGDTRLERGSMVHTLGSLWWTAPCKVNVRAAIPTGPKGWHPTIWSVQIQNNQFGYNGSEHGWECDGVAVTSAYDDMHTNGNVTLNSGNLNTGMANRSSAPHDWCIDESNLIDNELTYYVDGAQVNQLTLSGTSSTYRKTLPSYAIWTSHIGTIGTPFEGYDSTSWATAGAAGANFDIYGFQIWVPAGGTWFKPQVAIPDQLIIPGQAFSYTTPSSATLWGVANVASQYTSIPVESEEPGNTDTGWPSATAGSGIPPWMTATANANGSVTFAGTFPTVGASTNISGALQMAIGYCPSGNACSPATFRIVVAPCFIGVNTVAWVQGTGGSSYDLYAAWDIGRNFVNGATTSRTRKALTATGLPSGMVLDDSGHIAGTPATPSSGTITTTATNNDGQTATATITYTITAAVAAIAAPTGLTTSGMTLVGSWEPQAGHNTTTGSVITSLGGADGTSTALTGTSTKGMTLTTATDGNGATRLAAQALSATGQYLTATTSALGLLIASGCTVVFVGMPTHARGNTSNATMSLIDIGQSGVTLNVNHFMLLCSATAGTGFDLRRNGSTNTGSGGVTQGADYVANTTQVVVMRTPAFSTAANGTMNIGSGANLTGVGATDVFTGLDTLTIGASNEAVIGRFADMRFFKILVYKGMASDADEVIIKNWAQTNFGAIA